MIESEESTKAKRKHILELLEPMFEQAERESLWFRSNYQGVSFSPTELRKEQAQGRLIWGPVNWTLFNPETLLKNAEREYDKAIEHNAEIWKRIKK